MDMSPTMDVGRTLRTVRCTRRLSQRELAEIAGLPSSAVSRAEAGTSIPRLDTFVRIIAAAGYELALRDRHGRVLEIRDENGRHRDRGDRRFPAHLPTDKVNDYFDPAGANWWGWHNIAWPFNDDWVPDYTYWRRPAPPEALTGREPSNLECGRVWDDAT